MRFAVCGVLVLCLFAVTMASPTKSTKLNACSKDCGEKYEPVCAKAKEGSKERLLTFGNECVLSNFNCMHTDDPYEIKSKGECGGNVSVRLS